MPTRTLIGFATAALIVFAAAAALGIVGRVCLPKPHAAGDVQKPAALAAATSLPAAPAVAEPDDPVIPAGTELAEPIVRPELDPKPAPVAEIVAPGAERVRLAAAAPWWIPASAVDEPLAPSLAVEPDLTERPAAPSLFRPATPSLPLMAAGPAWLGPAVVRCPRARADDGRGASWSRTG